MLLKYIGHACFYIETKNGTRIVIDPYDNSIGLTPVNETADILLISHHHYDHDYSEGVHGSYELYDAPGSYTSHGISIKGIELPHDDADGQKRGKVTAFIIEADNMRIMHMGDVGIVPDDAFFANAGRIDILMLPIGGVYTVDAEQAVEIMDRLDPNITIPMHYKSHKLKMDIDGPHKFEKVAKKKYDISHLTDETFEISADNLKKRDRVLFMENSY